MVPWTTRETRPSTFARDYFDEMDMAPHGCHVHLIAPTDALTNLPNRRAFRVAGEAAKSEHDELVLAIIDIDHFKRINDTLGHAAGDHVLVELAHTLIDVAPAGHLVARLGGEEFGWLMPATSEDRAEKLIDSVHATLAQRAAITVSCGLASQSRSGNIEELFREADQTLYLAKEGGRNKTVRWSARTDRRTTPSDHPEGAVAVVAGPPDLN